MTPEEYEAPTTIASLYSVLLELFSQRRWLLPLPLTQPFTTYSFDYLIFAWSKTCSYIPSRLVDVQGANVICLLTLAVMVHCNYEHTPMAVQCSRPVLVLTCSPCFDLSISFASLTVRSFLLRPNLCEKPCAWRIPLCDKFSRVIFSVAVLHIKNAVL